MDKKRGAMVIFCPRTFLIWFLWCFVWHGSRGCGGGSAALFVGRRGNLILIKREFVISTFKPACRSVRER